MENKEKMPELINWGQFEGIPPSLKENNETVIAAHEATIKQSMQWIVKIENKSNQRIMVKFDPMKELLYFIGQYKIKINWIDFSQEEYSMNITLEVIQDILFKVYEKMNERLKVHEDLNKSFEIIKVIEIKEEVLNS